MRHLFAEREFFKRSIWHFEEEQKNNGSESAQREVDVKAWNFVSTDVSACGRVSSRTPAPRDMFCESCAN